MCFLESCRVTPRRELDRGELRVRAMQRQAQCTIDFEVQESQHTRIGVGFAPMPLLIAQRAQAGPSPLEYP